MNPEQRNEFWERFSNITSTNCHDMNLAQRNEFWEKFSEVFSTSCHDMNVAQRNEFWVGFGDVLSTNCCNMNVGKRNAFWELDWLVDCEAVRVPMFASVARSGTEIKQTERRAVQLYTLREIIETRLTSLAARRSDCQDR